MTSKHTPECTCHSTDPGALVYHCPMHKAALALLEALQELINQIERDVPAIYPGSPLGFRRAVARAAIAQALGETVSV